MKLSSTKRYAIQAILHLADASAHRAVPCGELARAGGMPERHLLQILATLVSHGILRSSRGSGGGYVLARPPEDISLLEIIETVDGRDVSDLPTALNVSIGRRKTEAVLDRITQIQRQSLAAVKLGHLLPDEPAGSRNQSDAGRHGQRRVAGEDGATTRLRDPRAEHLSARGGTAARAFFADGESSVYPISMAGHLGLG
jgi:Rrf2 family protein